MLSLVMTLGTLIILSSNIVVIIVFIIRGCCRLLIIFLQLINHIISCNNHQHCRIYSLLRMKLCKNNRITITKWLKIYYKSNRKGALEILYRKTKETKVERKLPILSWRRSIQKCKLSKCLRLSKPFIRAHPTTKPTIQILRVKLYILTILITILIVNRISYIIIIIGIVKIRK